MIPTPRGRRTIHLALVGGVILFILLATLGRTELPPPGVRNIDWCFSCGSQWGIDFVLNIVLFVPLGLALRFARVARRRAFLIVVATTLAIELTQLLIPGRITSTGDLLANAIGGIGGYELAAFLWAIVAPTARQAGGFALASGVAVPAILGMTLWLFGPAPTEHFYWGQFAPTLGQFVKFHGRVVEASVGEEPLRNGRLANSAAVRQRLREDGTVVRAVVVPGTPTPALAPAVSIFDGRHNEIMLLGRDGDDLVFRRRSRAMELGLRTPSITVWNAYRLGSGDPERQLVRLAGTVRGYSISAEARADTASASRTIHFRHTHGWAYLMPFEHLYTPGAPRFTTIWLAMLFSPLGYYAAHAVVRLRGLVARLGVAAWVAIVAGVSLVAVPAAADLAPATPWEWRGAAYGIATGALLAALVLAVPAVRRRRPAA